MEKSKNFLDQIVSFFDRLEDRTRIQLSKYPILYTFVGGTAIVLFWRGVWHTADLFPWLTGPVSIIISTAVLLLIGLFVSFFVGDNIIISGINREKKIVEKTEAEVEEEGHILHSIKNKVDAIEREIQELKSKSK
jgi:hypothetical protein